MKNTLSDRINNVDRMIVTVKIDDEVKLVNKTSIGIFLKLSWKVVTRECTLDLRMRIRHTNLKSIYVLACIVILCKIILHV